jgi:hypothetical protein
VRFSDASEKGAVFLAARWRFLANFLSTPQGVNWQNALFFDGAQPEKLHPSEKRFHVPRFSEASLSCTPPTTSCIRNRRQWE